jgi:hypothetical protein
MLKAATFTTAQMKPMIKYSASCIGRGWRMNWPSITLRSQSCNTTRIGARAPPIVDPLIAKKTRTFVETLKGKSRLFYLPPYAPQVAAYASFLVAQLAGLFANTATVFVASCFIPVLMGKVLVRVARTGSREVSSRASIRWPRERVDFGECVDFLLPT